MSGISTHVLDTSRGLPGAGISVTLEREDAPGRWSKLAGTKTDADGRVKTLLPPSTSLETGTYRLRFETGVYLATSGGGTGAFFPHVEVVFNVADASRNYHVPLLLSPFGYSTYRGT